MEFANGSWVLLRLSGTEPLLRVYTEAATHEESRNIAKETEAWVFDSAQEAKAWARIGDRRMTEVALDKGRRPSSSH